MCVNLPDNVTRLDAEMCVSGNVFRYTENRSNYRIFRLNRLGFGQSIRLVKVYCLSYGDCSLLLHRSTTNIILFILLLISKYVLKVSHIDCSIMRLRDQPCLAWKVFSRNDLQVPWQRHWDWIRALYSGKGSWLIIATLEFQFVI